MNIPIDIENIIIDYKNEFEKISRYNKVIDELNAKIKTTEYYCKSTFFLLDYIHYRNYNCVFSYHLLMTIYIQNNL